MGPVHERQLVKVGEIRGFHTQSDVTARRRSSVRVHQSCNGRAVTGVPGTCPSGPGRRGRRQPGTRAPPTAGAGRGAARAHGGQPARRPWTRPAAEVPVSQLLGTRSDGAERLHRINQVVDIVRAAIEVLGEEFQSQVAGETAGPVTLPRDRSARDGRAWSR